MLILDLKVAIVSFCILSNSFGKDFPSINQIDLFARNHNVSFLDWENLFSCLGQSWGSGLSKQNMDLSNYLVNSLGPRDGYYVSCE